MTPSFHRGAPHLARETLGNGFGAGSEKGVSQRERLSGRRDKGEGLGERGFGWGWIWGPMADCGAFWEQEGIQDGGQDGLESGQRPDSRALWVGFEAVASRSRYPEAWHQAHIQPAQPAPDSQGCSQQEALFSYSPAQSTSLRRCHTSAQGALLASAECSLGEVRRL